MLNIRNSTIYSLTNVRSFAAVCEQRSLALSFVPELPYSLDVCFC